MTLPTVPTVPSGAISAGMLQPMGAENASPPSATEIQKIATLGLVVNAAPRSTEEHRDAPAHLAEARPPLGGRLHIRARVVCRQRADLSCCFVWPPFFMPCQTRGGTFGPGSCVQKPRHHSRCDVP